MSKWIEASKGDIHNSAVIIATEKQISETSVEKDWWVTAILKVLFSLSPSKYMFFKGGTSLSKGWSIIDRFSEDIDIALYRDFYLDVLNAECAEAKNNNQVKKLRILNRNYLVGTFAAELKDGLKTCGLAECNVLPITNKPDGAPIDHDSDPVVIEVEYSPKVRSDFYVRPVVKIEISCLSMKEPYEVRRISSLIGERFPMLDDETVADIPTVSPTRTFLEKAFLLNEEYQRNNPRTNRMSRHLYDLERLMDTTFAQDALSNLNLYQEIIEHRRRFYHVGGVDYSKDMPATVSFCPEGTIRMKMAADYEVMKDSMIYGDKLTFEELMTRLEVLQRRFRDIIK